MEENKKFEELNDDELENVTGGSLLHHLFGDGNQNFHYKKGAKFVSLKEPSVYIKLDDNINVKDGVCNKEEFYANYYSKGLFAGRKRISFETLNSFFRPE